MNTRQHILALFEDSRGDFISGAAIAQQLGISRSAVWKAVKELEKEGHHISAVRNKGYRLERDDDVLSVAGMLPYLDAGIDPSLIQVNDQLESTNKTAKELILEGAGQGTMVIANEQTAGRGRYGRSFQSPAGTGIYVSFVIDPKVLSFSTPTLVTAYAAVCVCEAIEAVCDLQPQIKWVNDIYVDSAKICGIATEAQMSFESAQASGIVVGIGINFREPTAGFVPEDRNVIGSLFGQESPPVSRNQLIAEIANRILAEKAPAESDLLTRYRQRLFILGQRVRVTRVKEPYEAVALDVNPLGQLVVRTDSGEVLELSSGEVSIKPL